jgi:rhomboid protease GluP
MAYVTLYHNTFGFRFYISTSDNFSSVTASIETIIRAFGSLFIHADIGHLSSNLVLLIPFGWLLINYFGPLAFPVIAIIGGIITNIITIYIYKNDYYQTSLVGASGMAYAIVSQWIVLYLKWDRRYSLTERIIRSIGVAMMLLIPSQFSPKTSYLAHGVGFIVGIICALPFLRGSDSE